MKNALELVWKCPDPRDVQALDDNIFRVAQMRSLCDQGFWGLGGERPDDRVSQHVCVSLLRSLGIVKTERSLHVGDGSGPLKLHAQMNS